MNFPDQFPKDGQLHLCLKHLLFKESPEGARADFTLTVLKRDGVFLREGEGRAPTFHGSLSWITLKGDPPDWSLEGLVVPDAWVPYGGPLQGRLLWDGTDFRYEVTLRGVELSGECSYHFEERFIPNPKPLEHPEILDHFDQQGSAGRLYDFSRAGFHYGEEPLPAEGLPEIDVRDLGVHPDSGEECLPALQKIVDQVGQQGGGVITFPPGRFDFNLHEFHAPLQIRHSHIVLRGSGYGPAGTLWVNHRPSTSPQYECPWMAGYYGGFVHAGPLSQAEMAEQDLAEELLSEVTAGRRGSDVIQVVDASGLKVGDVVLLQQLEDAEGSLARHLVMDCCEPSTNYQGEGTPLVRQLVRILGVEGNEVTLDNALHLDIGRWRAELRGVTLLHGVGVERIRMRSDWDGYFEHHLNPEHDNGWDHIHMGRMCDSWMRDLVHENTTSAGGFSNSKCCSSLDRWVTGNPGHNSYGLGGCSTDCLYLRLHAGQNMHGFNLNATMTGNVFLDCDMDEPGGLDFHGGIGLDNLFDNLVGGVNAGGGGPGAVPPRHARGLVMWNCQPGRYTPYKAWKQVDTLLDTASIAGFIAVGNLGRYSQPLRYEGPEGTLQGESRSPLHWIESPNRHVLPRSLYLWQRRKRTPELPAYLEQR